MATDAGGPATRDDHAPSATTIASLRSAIERHIAVPFPDGELRRALRALVSESRAKQLHAEDAVRALKQLWDSIPASRSLDPAQNRALRERLVSLCIDEYYDGR